MRKLSTGQDSTLGTYLDLSQAVFGDPSPAVDFLRDKIAQAADGRDEEVIADEAQMLYLLMSIHQDQRR